VEISNLNTVIDFLFYGGKVLSIVLWKSM